MTVLFRCDANPVLGFGHLARCRALGKALNDRNQRCLIIGPDVNYVTEADHEIFDKWIPVSHWESSETDSRRVVDLASFENADWLVLDDYRVDEAYQHTLLSSKFRWLQFDGFADRPLWANIVLNPNPAARKEDYDQWIRNEKTQLLLGPRYSILRDEFSELNQRDLNPEVKRVLVTFGGGSDRGGIDFVLSSLMPVTPDNLKFIIVSGRENPSNESLALRIRAYPSDRVELCIGLEKLATLFRSCDIAIVSGGASSHEVARCGVPMILISIAHNQVWPCQGWENLGLGLYLGDLQRVTTDSLQSTFVRLFNDSSLRRRMSLQSRQLIASNGADTVADLLSG